jgi:hypothetical protein
VLQDVRKAQSLGFAFDDGITIVEGDVTKGARYATASLLRGHIHLLCLKPQPVVQRMRRHASFT